MRRTGWLFSLLVVAQLLSSAYRSEPPITPTRWKKLRRTTAIPNRPSPEIVISECVLVVLYLVPQTSVIAAILLTGYLGGAVATHLRIADVARAAVPLLVGTLAGRAGLEDGAFAD